MDYKSHPKERNLFLLFPVEKKHINTVNNSGSGVEIKRDTYMMYPHDVTNVTSSFNILFYKMSFGLC